MTWDRGDDAAIAFEDLGQADLLVGTVYRGGTAGTYGDDPISKLIGGGNQGGIRFEGSLPRPHFVVLYSTFEDEEWPDHFTHSGRRLVYFGDNKKPGAELHRTPKHGNETLRDVFDAYHRGDRLAVPPILFFGKAGKGRDVIFEGLCVPGAHDLAEDDDLVAFWRSSDEGRFLNYRAIFTTLLTSRVQREFINGLQQRNIDSTVAPRDWEMWRDSGWTDLDLSTPITRTWRPSHVGGSK